jgi:hypothetical protein
MSTSSRWAVLSCLVASLLACGPTSAKTGRPSTDAGTGTSSDAGPTSDAGSSVDAGLPPDAGLAVTAANLLALMQHCTQASPVLSSTDDGLPATIPICSLKGAFFWKADMDVDCDGQVTTSCNPTTDPAFQAETSLEDSQGHPLNAAVLPYFVVPLPSTQAGGFDYQASGLHLGAVGLVIVNGQLAWGVFGDEGPDNIIGEASYAMAQSLGVDPDPSTGGRDAVDVTYLVFTGSGALLPSPEDHAAAVSLGQTLAAKLLADN